MDRLERVALRIGEVIANSTVPEDPEHSRNTREWLLKLDPKADGALRIAALGHDIDRAVAERKVRRADFADYDTFKAAHARNSATIVGEIMRECCVEDEALTGEVQRLVCLHEVGGDPRSDLLKDADSLSYFDVNLPHYAQRHGWQETRRRCVWGYLRLSEGARSIAAGLPYPSDELQRLMDESIREAETLARARSREPTVGRSGSGSAVDC